MASPRDTNFGYTTNGGEVGVGWAPHPKGKRGYADWDMEGRYRGVPELPQSDRSSRVVGIGALCELGEPRPASDPAQGFAISEFVLLENGRRIILHNERGVTIGTSGPGPARSKMDANSIVSSVLGAVLPDDVEDDEEHPWLWLAALATARGLHATADELKALPYEVVLADSVTEWLAGP
jgi:hypothetical protein